MPLHVDYERIKVASALVLFACAGISGWDPAGKLFGRG